VWAGGAEAEEAEAAAALGSVTTPPSTSVNRVTSLEAGISAADACASSASGGTENACSWPAPKVAVTMSPLIVRGSGGTASVTARSTGKPVPVSATLRSSAANKSDGPIASSPPPALSGPIG
jgi:hypothetical protein